MIQKNNPSLRAAIVYDFDGTLSPGNIQEHSFIPSLDISIEDFWKSADRIAEENDADSILVYMWQMLEMAKKKEIAITRELLHSHAQNTPFFTGLPQWFNRINQYAQDRGLELEHYIISSGIYEMIEGCSIFSNFKKVFASRFMYQNGKAVWPAVAINYTNKTQFLFRINKGIDNTWDNQSVNRWQPMKERPVPFERMVFLGDGDTDIPTMKMVRHQGGHSIAVFDPEKWNKAGTQEKVYKLIAEDRVHFVAPADYSGASQLDVTVKGILGRIARGDGYRGG